MTPGRSLAEVLLIPPPCVPNATTGCATAMKLIRLLPTRLAIAMQHSQTTRQRYSLNADADMFRDCYDFAAVCSKRNDWMLKRL